MHSSYIGGKGDKRRPEDLKSFDEGFERIFRNQVPKQKQEKTVAPKQETTKNITLMPDIQPYQSMITGEIITSRSKHRQHLKDHNMVEVGNDSSIMKPHQIPDANPRQRKELLIHQVNQIPDKQWRRMSERHRQAVIRHMEKFGKD